MFASQLRGVNPAIAILSGARWWIAWTSSNQTFLKNLSLDKVIDGRITMPAHIHCERSTAGRHREMTITMNTGITITIRPKLILHVPTNITLEQLQTYYRRLRDTSIVEDEWKRVSG